MKIKELIEKLQSFNDPEAEVVLCNVDDDTETGTYGINEGSISYTKGENKEGEEVMGALICFSY